MALDNTFGLIPARAGNTNEANNNNNNVRAHPRSRGEHRFSRRATSNSPGSSPLARGTPLSHKEITGYEGLIPARAGNTGIGRHTIKVTGAHPRSRGEHSLVQFSTRNVRGSSPLARGTHTVSIVTVAG